MASVVRSLLHDSGTVRKAFFYWTKRESNSPDFFELMEEIHRVDTQGLVEIRHFTTGLKPDKDDLGDVLIHQAASAVFDEPSSENLDIFLGYRTHHHQVSVGRPNWQQELYRAAKTTKSLIGRGTKCGVFFCGPATMAKEVQRECVAVSRQEKGIHMHFTKEIF